MFSVMLIATIAPAGRLVPVSGLPHPCHRVAMAWARTRGERHEPPSRADSCKMVAISDTENIDRTHGDGAETRDQRQPGMHARLCDELGELQGVLQGDALRPAERARVLHRAVEQLVETASRTTKLSNSVVTPPCRRPGAPSRAPGRAARAPGERRGEHHQGHQQPGRGRSRRRRAARRPPRQQAHRHRADPRRRC